MFRSAPEKHCLGRSHHSCSFSTKLAICYCYVNISNSRKKKPNKTPARQQKTSSKTIYTYYENKTNPKTSPCLCKHHHLCLPPLCSASHSHSISLLGWRQFTSWKTHICFSGCFSKANQSHPAWIPTTSTNPLFAGL